MSGSQPAEYTMSGNLPQIRLPTSKMKMETKNDIFSGKYLYAFPHAAWKLPRVIKNPEPYHPSSLIPPNSSVIFGIAVATIVCGNHTC
jgi:hypothetical protein